MAFNEVQAKREEAAKKAQGGSRNSIGSVQTTQSTMVNFGVASRFGAVGFSGNPMNSSPSTTKPSLFAPTSATTGTTASPGMMNPSPAWSPTAMPTGSFGPTVTPPFGQPKPAGFLSQSKPQTMGASHKSGGGSFTNSQEMKLYSPTEGSGKNTASSPIKKWDTNANQYQQQLDNSARIQAQLAAFGIAEMVLPKEEKKQGSTPPDSSLLIPRGGGEEVQPSTFNPTDYILKAPRRQMMQCFIHREKNSNFKTFMNPNYYLYYETGEVFMLAARRRGNKQTSNYLISFSADDLDRKSAAYAGKVRSNFSGSEFVIYDKGERPTPTTQVNPSEDDDVDFGARQELGAMLYDQNKPTVKQPRKMRVLLPVLNKNDMPEKWVPQTEEESMIAAYKVNPDSPPRLNVLQTKDPTWCEQLRAYQLNFKGRVKCASIKNFQLVDQKNTNRIVLQFGKVSDDRFAMDFAYPLNAIQAFSICLTVFDNKLIT